MNNQELEQKIKEILNISNFFDMITEAKKFEKEYKKSDFYTLTRMDLMTVLTKAKMWYVVDFKEITTKTQAFIDNLSLDKIENIIDTAITQVQTERTADLALIKELQEIVK